MAIGPRLGSQNKLVQRVRRHRAVATLFRRAADATAIGGAEAGGEPPALPTRRAVPVEAADVAGVPVVAEPVTPGRWDGQRVIATPADRTVAPPDRQPSSPQGARSTMPAVGRQPEAQAASSQPQPPAARPTPPRPTEPTSTEAQPATAVTAAGEPEGDTTLTDQVWRRLQTIFRRHQVTQEAALEPGEPAETAPAAQAATPSPPENTPGRDAAEGDVAPARTVPLGSGPLGSGPQASGSLDIGQPSSRPPSPASPPAEPAVRAAAPANTGDLPTLGLARPTVPDLPGPAADRAVDGTETIRRPLETASEPAAGTADAMAPSGTPVPPTPVVRETVDSPRPSGPARPAAPPPAQPPETDRDEMQSIAAGEPVASGPDQMLAVHPSGPSVLAAGEDFGSPAADTGVQVPLAPIVAEAETPAGPEPAADDAVAPPLPQQPPLQQVWQVERIAPRGPAPAGGTRPTAATGPSVSRRESEPEMGGAGRTLGQPPPERAAGREAGLSPTATTDTILQRVAAGRPTRSSIETIAPRRPRPRPRPPEARAAAPAQPTPPVAEPSGSGRQETDRRPAPSAPAQPASAPTVARGVDEGNGAGGARSTLVATEIGPLPSDLWDLIGETPPAVTTPDAIAGPEPDAETDTAPPVVAPATSPATPVLQRSVVPLTAQAPTPSAVPGDAAAPAAAASRRLEAQSQAEAPGAEAAAGTVVDVEKLAHRVYAELKRRLAVEWERLRTL